MSKIIEKHINKLIEERRIMLETYFRPIYDKPDKLRLKGIDKEIEKLKIQYPEYFI